MPIRRGFNLPFYPLALARKGKVCSTTKCTFLSRKDRVRAWWSTQLWVRELHPVFVKGITWMRVVFIGNHCHDTSHQHVPPRRATLGFCLRSPSTRPPPSYFLTNVCVCVCVFIKLHITAQSGPVILVILCHSH